MLQLNELIENLGGDLVSESKKDLIRGFSTDSRTICKNECFIALRGPRFDGHSYILKAYERGASAFVIDYTFLTSTINSDDDSFINYVDKVKHLPNVIVVEDTIKSLGYLASYVRGNFTGSCVGITGSCGKTTTKELCKLVLSAKYSVMCNQGNFNNHIGLPLTLLKLDSSYEVLVCEMGASARGDIKYLSDLLRPEVGIITNVHPVHLEGFKTIDNVYKTKLELAEYLDKINGTLIINGDDENLVREVRNYNLNIITFGKRKYCDFVLSSTEYIDGMLHCEVNGKYKFILNTIGYFNVFNALSAIALADFYKIDFPQIKDTFSSFVDLERRFKIKKGDSLIIDDTYNANPFSFSQSLDIFRKIQARRKKIVVCGDMLELGSESEEFHRKLGKDIVSSGANVVVALGNEIKTTIDVIKSINSDIHCVYFENTASAINFLKEELGKGDAVLLKASRGIKLDEVAQAL